MQVNQLSDLKLYFIIPRKGKGHNEVISNVTILTTTENIQPEDFLGFFVEYQKKVLSPNVLEELGNKIIENLKLKDLEIHFTFNLPVDRLSIALDEAVCFNLACGYSFVRTSIKQTLGMVISCPIRIDYMSTIEGILQLSLYNPAPNIYFEDLFDIVQKYGNVVIYPLNRLADKEALQKEIGGGKTVKDYIDFIKVACIRKDISESGKVKVSFGDTYRVYNIDKTVGW